MKEQSLISPEVLARYAADAAREVSGVTGLAESPMHRDRPIEVSGSSDAMGITFTSSSGGEAAQPTSPEKCSGGSPSIPSGWRS